MSACQRLVGIDDTQVNPAEDGGTSHSGGTKKDTVSPTEKNELNGGASSQSTKKTVAGVADTGTVAVNDATGGTAALAATTNSEGGKDNDVGASLEERTSTGGASTSATIGPAGVGNDGSGGTTGFGGTSATGGTTGFGGTSATGGTTQLTSVDLTPESRRFITQNPWPETTISICYEATDSDVVDVSVHGAFVKSQVTRHWQRVADVQFSNWENCENGGGSIRLEFTTKEPSYAYFGFPGWYKQATVRLNTNHLSAAEVLYFFGRVLGFGHEYNVDSLPGPCQPCKKKEDCIGIARSTCMASGVCGNPLEHESIMAPPVCGKVESIRKFSPWDIAGARWTYGQKPTGSLVSGFGECAQVGWIGDTVYLGFCQGFDGDALKRYFATADNEYDQFGSMYLPDPICLAASSTSTDSLLFSAACDNTNPAQNLTMRDVRLRGLGGLCVVVAQASEGAALTVANCGAASPTYLERWTVETDRLRLSGSNLCATVKDNDIYVGAPIVLRQCGSSPAYQTLRMRAGRIQNNGLCFDVAGGLPEVGKPIILWNSCSFQLDNDDFYLSGAVSTSPNRCLAVKTTNDPLLSAMCEDTLNQEWDYHF